MTSTDDVLPSFGSLNLNADGGTWGPSEIPVGFKDMPYQPFSRDIKLGKFADWCLNADPYGRPKSKEEIPLNFYFR